MEVDTMFWNWGAFNKDADVPICLSYAKEEEPVIHYDADFQRAATVLDFQHRWVLPRGSP